MILMGKQNACGFPYIFSQFVFLDMLIAFFIQVKLAPSCKMYLNMSVYIFFVKVI